MRYLIKQQPEMLRSKTLQRSAELQCARSVPVVEPHRVEHPHISRYRISRYLLSKQVVTRRLSFQHLVFRTNAASASPGMMKYVSLDG
jgi:hypothetical protein